MDFFVFNSDVHWYEPVLWLLIMYAVLKIVSHHMLPLVNNEKPDLCPSHFVDAVRQMTPKNRCAFVSIPTSR